MEEIIQRAVLDHQKKGVLYQPMNPANINYRLLQEWEVPEWIKIKPEDPNRVIQEFGQGKRQRKQVNYNDEFSEGQWLKIIEQGGDPS